jgi:signal transduction histidine kinase
MLMNNNAKAKNISLNCEISDGLMVYADINMLNTVLRNLISNGIKFTNKNGNISIKAIQQSTDIEITVNDTGIGMSEKTINKLFKISEKVSTLGTENENGTGLGLLLCKEFIEKHGGRIRVKSEVGKGSEFKFTIPLRND